MRDIVKMLFIPIVGMVAIGILFLLVIYGGRWESNVDNSESPTGLVIEDVGAYDAVIADRGRCDTSLYTPVCGYDGATYDNPCLAARAGIDVAHRGQCA